MLKPQRIITTSELFYLSFGMSDRVLMCFGSKQLFCKSQQLLRLATKRGTFFSGVERSYLMDFKSNLIIYCSLLYQDYLSTQLHIPYVQGLTPQGQFTWIHFKTHHLWWLRTDYTHGYTRTTCSWTL